MQEQQQRVRQIKCSSITDVQNELQSMIIRKEHIDGFHVFPSANEAYPFILLVVSHSQEIPMYPIA